MLTKKKIAWTIDFFPVPEENIPETLGLEEFLEFI